jgi:structural maintenance of chromosome 4
MCAGMHDGIDFNVLFALSIQAAQASVQELWSKAGSLQQKAEEARASQAASTSQKRVLDSLTKLKQTGQIDGFHVWSHPLCSLLITHTLSHRAVLVA